MDNNYNIIRIQRYLQGQLSPEEMYSLEREALEDPFLQDAIDGYRMQKEVNHGTLSLLQQRLAARVEKQREERDQFFFGGQRLGVAATACVLFILVVVLFWMRSNWWNDGTAATEGLKQVEVELPVAPESPQALPREELGIRMSLFSLPDAPSGEPVGGWEAFGEYLLAEADWSAVPADSLPGAGTLFSVEFDIDRHGRATAIRVDTLTTTGAVPLPIREEVIRLLKQGPAWKGAGPRLQVEFYQQNLPE